MGPEPPPPARPRKPEWVRILEEDAAVDEEVAALLEGTGGDPDRIRERMQQKLSQPMGSPGGAAAGPLPFQPRTGSDVPPRITFREVDVFDLWVWLELAVPPSERERELLTSTVRSWFVVGKLGGYNTSNLQVYYNGTDDTSFMDYDADGLSSAYSALMHSASDPEFRGSWARFNVDLGTADELAIDVLLNMLVGFSAEVAGVSRIIVGGEHERWALPGAGGEDEDGEEASGEGRRRAEHGEAPRVGMNPMRLPQGIEEELELLDELGELYNAGKLPHLQQQQQQQQQPGLRPVNPAQPLSGLGQPRGAGGGGGAARQRGRQQQQQQQRQQGPPPPLVDGGGMRMYSPEEFRAEFNVRDEDEGGDGAAGGP